MHKINLRAESFSVFNCKKVGPQPSSSQHSSQPVALQSPSGIIQNLHHWTRLHLRVRRTAQCCLFLRAEAKNIGCSQSAVANIWSKCKQNESVFKRETAQCHQTLMVEVGEKTSSKCGDSISLAKSCLSKTHELNFSLKVIFKQCFLVFPQIMLSRDARNTAWVSFDGRRRQEICHGDRLVLVLGWGTRRQ